MPVDGSVRERRRSSPALRAAMTLVLLLLGVSAAFVLAVPPTISGNITFHPPVSLGTAKWGVTMFAAFNHSTHAVQMPHGMMQVTVDGGKTYRQQSLEGVPIASNLVPGPRGPHDFGNISAHHVDPGPWTALSSPSHTVWSVESGGLRSRTEDTPVSFSRLPVPIRCDKSYGTCPIRLQGCGLVRFGDGTLLQSAIVFYDGNPQFPRATSVVVFRSTDGGSDWQYQGTIANATDYSFSQEGPNEHDLAMLDFGQVLAVVRLDAGDGLASHPYVPYYYTISQDGGRTWPKMQPMPGTGCARPRLLQLGGGYAPLLMSGGRMKNNGSDDNLLWIDWTGVKFPATAPQWERYALSYYHNKLAPPGTPKFTAAVNDTRSPAETAACAHIYIRETRASAGSLFPTACPLTGVYLAPFVHLLADTALIQTGTCSAVVLYDLSNSHSAGRHGFSMRIDIHLDEGGEAGIHC